MEKWTRMQQMVRERMGLSDDWDLWERAMSVRWHSPEIKLACHHPYTYTAGDPSDPKDLIGEDRFCATCDRSWPVVSVTRHTY